MTRYDVAVVGGGCVGISTAKHLAERSDLDICVLEKEYHLAEHQSGRNSGVLHPGFNYPPGSLKARFSTEGTSRMKEYAAENDIPIEGIQGLHLGYRRRDYLANHGLDPLSGGLPLPPDGVQSLRAKYRVARLHPQGEHRYHR